MARGSPVGRIGSVPAKQAGDRARATPSRPPVWNAFQDLSSRRPYSEAIKLERAKGCRKRAVLVGERQARGSSGSVVAVAVGIVGHVSSGCLVSPAIRATDRSAAAACASATFHGRQRPPRGPSPCRGPSFSPIVISGGRLMTAPHVRRWALVHEGLELALRQISVAAHNHRLPVRIWRVPPLMGGNLCQLKVYQIALNRL